MSVAAPRHILMLANRTCPCPELHESALAQLTERPAQITIVAPALNDSKLAHWVSDTGRSEAAAAERLEQAIESHTVEGVHVTGHVGDAKPITALEDAIAQHPTADLLVLSTLPPGESHWLESGLLPAAERLDIPVRRFVSEFGIEDDTSAEHASATR